MDLLRERELKDSIERHLYDEQKLRGMFQKRLRKERRTRRNVQSKLDLELKRRLQLEEALRNNGAADQLRLINDSISEAELQLALKHNSSQLSSNLPPRLTTPHQPTDNQQQQDIDNNQQQQRDMTPTSSNQHPTTSSPSTSATAMGSVQSTSGGHVGPTVSFRSDLMPPKEPRPASTTGDQQQQGMLTAGGLGSGDVKPWGYSGLDLINSSAAFWQNYSDSLAQELELERKTHQQHSERDVKSPLQDRSGYYKNSVLFTSSAT